MTETQTKTFEKYPSYKDSGIDWLGEIPREWKCLKLKNIGIFSAGGIDKKVNEDEISVSMVNYMDIYDNPAKVIDKSRELMVVTSPEWKILQCNLKKGDLVFTPSSETSQDIGLSAVILQDLENTVYSYHVVRFRFTNEMDLRYKRYFCNNDLVLQQFSKASKGTTRQILNRIDFKNINVILPPCPEQQNIANFLDKQTAKIDQLIQKKQKLIDLLKEKRTALISQAVTKGLDLNVKMKDSGIPWLGQIPEQWEIKRLRFLIKTNPSKQNILLNSGDPITFLAMESVSEEGEVSLNEERSLSEVLQGYTYFINGDVILAKITPCFENGKGALVGGLKNGVGFGSTEFHVLRPMRINAKYLYLLTKTDQFRKIGEADMLGAAGQKRVPEMFIQNFKFGLPKADEQKEIVEFVHEKNDLIKKSISKIEQQIDKIKEYRTALISAAVTGKIKFN